ncbi:phage tail spike protein [Lactococcus formosensis]|uniref:phage tail spike protein n=1 Tax=Lactococcus formosensis TaxID=1281486 RepID=UPI0024358201|nr:phage tail spike protein [Lactococcus formosensis]MDG6113743.1 tail fiber domain-containing protein [Lactococcus formosensis]MDG6122266.1 tail fiber domain-containing protein [Lactococcus formosensis]MDG6151872.1 tail fiber domain-containing protein [Lactococcus formosensis]MDG6174908.1 tail fiber domain-containing protein [Lactococcus formosensis]MDG6181226.1 tail fiber domain-containing protein [Lactococcus formosensis]
MTYPILYSPEHTDFNNLGLGVMVDTISATVSEELNGKFELELVYQATGSLFKYIVKNGVIKVNTGDQENQLFVIKKVTKPLNGKIGIHAEHVSYITNDLPIKPSTKVVESVAQVALNKMLSAIADKHPLTAYSDITTISSAEWKVPDFKNPRNILGRVEGSILDQWGGEYQFDNYQIRLMSQRGRYSNTIIAYGRNLTDFEQEESILETYTSIYPYANETSNDSTVLRTLPEFFVDSEYVDKYPNRRVAMVDFSDKFNDKNPYSEDKLRKFAQSYVKANKVGVPKVTMKVSTVDLSGSLDESYNVEEVESLHLADTVKVFFESLGVTAEAKVVGSVWNVLLEQYDSYTLGAKKASFDQWVNNNVNEIKNAADSAKQTAINAAISANGKSTNWYGNKGDGFPPNPKKGDLYFEQDGDKKTMYQWDGTSWVVQNDTAWQEDFEQEMQDKLDQAKQENDAAFADLDKQLSDAQTAIDNVDASNQALSDAVDQANKDIKAVDDVASQAMSTALDGKSLAENAKELGQEALDNFKNLSIGGRNLISNSAFLGDDNKDGIPNLWIKGGATATSKLVTITDLNQIATGVEITQTALGQSGLRTQKFVENIIGDKSYVQTFWIKNIATEPLNMILQTGERNKETNAVTYTSINQEVPGNSDWIRLSRIFNTKVTTNGLYFYLYTNNKTETAHYLLAAPKFEEGTVPTDSTPAPEDTQVKIEQLENGLKTTVSQSQYNADQSLINSQISSVTQTANSINSVVTDLTNGMPTGASIISQISDSVSIMVEKNDVINQINVSTEGILIAGEKVHITGTTLIDDAIITTAMIKELDASVITTGTLAANLIVPTAGNMLMNSEFQSNTFFDGWISGGSITGTDFYDSAATFTDEYGGNSTMAGINTINLEVTTSNFRTKFQDVRGKDGVAYSASMIVRMDNNAMDSAGGIGRAGLNLSFIDKDGKSITGTTVFIDASALKKPTLVINDNKIAPTGTKYVRVTLVASGKVNAYYTRIMLNRGAKALPYTASTGQVIVGSDMIVDGAIIAKHLSAESVTAEKLAVGAVNMGSAVVTGTLDANRINVINLDASQIKVGTLNAATVRIINLDASAITTGTLNVAVQINANSIVAGTLNAKLLTGDTAHLNSVDTGNITNNYDYHLQVSSKGLFNKTTNVGQLNLHSTQSGGTDWDAAFPGSMTYHFETSTNGQNTGLRFWKNHIMSLNKDQNTGLYLNPYGGTQVRVTSRTDDNTYLAINASAFNVASDRRFKSDIEDYEEDALSIVNGLRIRTYKKSGKREIGVIADEAPKALLLKDETGDMLSLYDYSSIAIKAIQELTDEVDLLKLKIGEMEKKIA